MTGRLRGRDKAKRDRAIAKLYAKGGRTLAEVAAEFGVAPSTAWEACREAGAVRPDPARGAPRRHPDRDADIMHRYYDLGETLEAIGEVYGIERERVRQIVGKGISRLPEADRLRRWIARYTALLAEAEAKLAVLRARNAKG